MTTPDVMINDAELTDLWIESRASIPGVFVVGYVGTQKTEIWLSIAMLLDLAGEFILPPKWPWEINLYVQI